MSGESACGLLRPCACSSTAITQRLRAPHPAAEEPGAVGAFLADDLGSLEIAFVVDQQSAALAAGDVLRLEVEIGQVRRSIGTGTGQATVDGELACRGEFMFALAHAPSSI